MPTLTVKTVEPIDETTVQAAMRKMGIDADLDLESGEGAQYDFAELTDNEGNVIFSTDLAGKMSRAFFDEVWSGTL